MKQRTPFTNHALERIAERYDVRLTKKQQLAFGKIFSNPRFTIKLTNNRLACYFERKWYLLAVSTYKMPTNMESTRTESLFIVQTSLRLEDANEDDKLVLRHSEQYRQINNDSFRVMSQSKILEPPHREKIVVEFPKPDEEDLAHDVIQSADRILKSICTDK